MKKMILFLVCVLCLTHICYSQVYTCGSDLLIQQLNLSNHHYAGMEDKFNQQEYHLAENRIIQKAQQTVYTIPVVVHVIHENGPENIADSIILQAIDQLNLRFQNTAPYFDSSGVNAGIQFCLATIDPMGNPTTGITRDTSYHTHILNYPDPAEDTALKNINRWEPLLYLNIWIVNSLNGIGGYATYPTLLGTSRDGIVIGYNYFNTPSLTHEAGHYFYLYHTFEGGCTNFNCMLDGDRVCDTPPDNSTAYVLPCTMNSCSTDPDDTTGLSPFTTDVNELFDYMDYTYCLNFFTPGQSYRMNDALIYLRNLLLQSNGCGSNPVGPPVAAYNYNVSACNNGEVTFTDSSSNFAIGAQWDFDGDGVFDTTGFTVTHIFPAMGTYTVKEYVQGVAGVDTISHTFFVQHAPSAFYPLIYTAGTHYDQYGNKAACQGDEIILTAAPGATSYLWFTGDTTQVIHISADSSFTIWVQITDTAGLFWNSQWCTPVPVVVYPGIPPFTIYADDSLIVCEGEQVHLHTTDPSVLYTYQWVMANLLINGATDSVYDFLASGWGINYWLQVTDSNGCSRNSDTIIVSSVPLPNPAVYSITANGDTLNSNFPLSTQWYADSVLIPGANSNTYVVMQPGCYAAGWYFPQYAQYGCHAMSDTICFTTVGINKSDVATRFIIYPNPTGNWLNIKGNGLLNGNCKMILTNPMGQILSSKEYGINNHFIDAQVDLRELPGGIYFLYMTSNNIKQVIKVQKY